MSTPAEANKKRVSWNVILTTALKAEACAFTFMFVIDCIREATTPGGIELVHIEASAACWLATLVCSIVLWRKNRTFAYIGLAGFILFGYLALTPHV
jgi:hypothetical protein